MKKGDLSYDIAQAIYEGRNGRGCRPWSTLPRDHQVAYIGDAWAALSVVRAALAVRMGAAEALFRAASQEAFARPNACSLDLLKAVGDWRTLPPSPLDLKS